ncbi:MAG TPA: SdrD B-like domain-containing protein [Pirellulales bacterium]|nr:SdrD B-like domain-containing protein [Pirellulales bacterium]
MLGRFVTSLARSSNSGRRARQGALRRHAKPARSRRGGDARVRLIEPLEKRLALSGDPIVTVDTNFGNFQIELLPSAAPQTVANFLNYVESGAYTDTIFHRSVQPTSQVPNIGIIQAGGFTSSSTTFTNVSQFQTIPTQPAIPLEYNQANAAGTVAMARTNDPNSATDEFFINDTDNSTTLGQSNGGGYAVFGKIIGNGMQVVNAIAQLQDTTDPSVANTPFAQLPLGPNNQLVQISSITLDSVDGTVFSDANANGTQDTGEGGVANRTVFVNVDGSGQADGKNPQATTDANGNFSISGVAPGTYTVNEVLPTGFGLSTPVQNVTVAANQTATGVTFGEIAPSITGTVFNDVNDNQTQDSGETGVAGRTVFLDIDGTHQPDAKNPSTITDATGNFGFPGLAAGPYTVAEVLPNGYTLSTPAQTVTVTAGQTTSSVKFGELVPSIVGTVFTDTNDNGKIDGGEGGVAGRVVFLNNDGTGLPANNPKTTTDATGQFAFPHLAPGTYTVMESLPANVTLSTGATGPTLTGSQSETVTAGQTASGVLFGEIPSIAGKVFTDVAGSGAFSTSDPGVAGRLVFVDVNGTGTATGNPQTTTDANGNFTFTGIAPGTYPVKEVLPTNVTASLTQSAVLVAAGSVATANLGELPSITGIVFTDNNNNGTFDTGDTPLANHTVIVDVDGSGKADGINPMAVTDTNGNFAISGVPAGQAFKVEDLSSSGAVLGSTSATVTAGQITKNVDLAEVPDNSTISGKVFDDLNMNGTLDPGEPGIAGRTVFLDIDGTGQPDATNPSTTTDANGNFSFTGLAAGPYTVSEVITPDHGTALTTATQSVTVGVNATQTVNLGDALTSTLAPLPISTNPITATNPTTAYIDGIYQHLLGRLPATADVTYWTTQMSGGTSRADVATSVWDSPEHRALEIGQYYQTFLGRAADPAGKAYWLNAFTQSWGTEKNVIATFVTSDEFSNRLHSSNTDYIDALYTDLDLRFADPSGLSGWQTALQNGESRLQAAFAFIDGQEASGQLVDGYYADFLHRAADTAGRQSWVNALTGGSASIEDVGVRILATDEYFSIVGAKNNT